ncbi:hypothetical protein ACFWM1_26415 [Nocardia sp. NPDC058379]|uniref:hypothetical protein n=1 Tax=unclassified Nocardia TaxID=2637762 RepID=UPI003658ED37
MPHDLEYFATATTDSPRPNLLIVGYIFTRGWGPSPGAVVTVFPDLGFRTWYGPEHTPMALVITSWDLLVPVAGPDELLQQPQSSAKRLSYSLVPVWIHRPRNQLVIAPHRAEHDPGRSARTPVGVRAHLPHAPATVDEIHSDVLIGKDSPVP